MCKNFYRERLQSEEKRYRNSQFKISNDWQNRIEQWICIQICGYGNVLDELNEFIKTERACCSFFTFDLSISGDKNEAWLELTGPDGVKDFITSELGL